MEGIWLRGGERKMMVGLTKKLSSQNEKKTWWREIWWVKDKNVHVQYAVFFLASIPLLSVSFILIPFFSSRDFFSKHDFFIKKKKWVIVFFFFFFGCLSLFCFNWASLFNKDIWVNLYNSFFLSLNFFTHNQIKMREIIIFFIPLLFYHLTIFYSLTFLSVQLNRLCSKITKPLWFFWCNLHWAKIRKAYIEIGCRSHIL